ncbi:hypothetical protein QWJ34_20925 [Saccharibacillus sp. CPCC 101409]|uniref:hypothetical protein n=1 Tax=Saccharibacillus sp. CPCC 101409 TaxID=3058041 RepID=UPI0026720D7E|nr:hypothetical protein [Saccharibacillus sp. CPCC 101409]MDO3412240.1 hypothetical protein [Saccharibacillus sp. CPCC 101409]
MVFNSSLWEKRPQITWDNLLALTRNFFKNGHGVVIDFVVEDELPWIREKFRFAELGAEVRYVVLEADTKRIIRQLERRGDPESFERSLFLRDKLRQEPLNAGFFLDTSGHNKEALLQSVKTASSFILISGNEEARISVENST